MKARPCLHSEAWIGFLQLQAARGHARAGERTRPAGIATNPRGPEESGLKMMKHGASLKAAARANGNQPGAFAT